MRVPDVERPEGTLEGNPDGWCEYIAALEAQLQRVEEGLRWIAEFSPTGDGGAEWAASVTRDKARAALPDSEEAKP